MCENETKRTPVITTKLSESYVSDFKISYLGLHQIIPVRFFYLFVVFYKVIQYVCFLPNKVPFFIRISEFWPPTNFPNTFPNRAPDSIIDWSVSGGDLAVGIGGWSLVEMYHVSNESTVSMFIGLEEWVYMVHGRSLSLPGPHDTVDSGVGHQGGWWFHRWPHSDVVLTPLLFIVLDW